MPQKCKKKNLLILQFHFNFLKFSSVHSGDRIDLESSNDILEIQIALIKAMLTDIYFPKEFVVFQFYFSKHLVIMTSLLLAMDGGQEPEL